MPERSCTDNVPTGRPLGPLHLAPESALDQPGAQAQLLMQKLFTAIFELNSFWDLPSQLLIYL